MAKKRMFRLDVLETDAFMDMPLTTQALYFHLNLRADDDGFVGNPNQIVRSIGASVDDLKLLIAKRFVLSFENGVIVIKHWRMHNTLSKGRYFETKYLEEKSMLKIKENNAYTLGNNGIELDDSHLAESAKRQKTNNRRTIDEHETNIDDTKTPIDALDKISIDKDSIDKDSNKPTKHIYGEYGHVRLTDDERNKLMDEYGEAETSEAIKYLDEYIEMKGYKAKSHYLCIKKWVFEAVNRNKPKQIDWNKV